MKVTFIYFDFMKGAEGKYYEGLASISAVLREKGYTTELFHITKRMSPGEFIDIFGREYADSKIAAFSSTTNAFPQVVSCAREIKKKFGSILTVCGGIHPTLCPDETIQEDSIDAICVGEGEYPMLELCSRLESNGDISHIQGLWIKNEGRIVKNATRPLIKDLDSLPVPDRTIFDYESSTDRKWGRLVFMASRGCPFQCTHCCNHAIRNVYPNPSAYIRYKSPDKFIEEIKYYLGKHRGINHICFQDDILTLNKGWFKKFTSRYAEEIHIPYICNSRFDLMDEEVIELLKNTGCIEIRIGLESGDDFIRKEVLKRNQDRKHILKVGRLCRKKGIRLSIFTMVGIPFENRRRLLNTVKMTADLRPKAIQTSIYYPYPKTELYKVCREKGYLTDKKLDTYFARETVLKLPDLSREEIFFGYDNFKRFVKYYEFISIFPHPVYDAFERLLDHLWLKNR